jgi:hypothetical protein
MFGDFDKQSERFDKHYERTQKTIWLGAIVSVWSNEHIAIGCRVGNPVRRDGL